MNIRCRANVSSECYDGKDEFEVYDSEGPGQSEDGTWDGESVACDSCYIALGTPTNEELPAMIAVFKAGRS